MQSRLVRGYPRSLKLHSKPYGSQLSKLVTVLDIQDDEIQGNQNPDQGLISKEIEHIYDNSSSEPDENLR